MNLGRISSRSSPREGQWRRAQSSLSCAETAVSDHQDLSGRISTSRRMVAISQAHTMDEYDEWDVLWKKGGFGVRAVENAYGRIGEAVGGDGNEL
jgi:hypothetical protein